MEVGNWNVADLAVFFNHKRHQVLHKVHKGFILFVGMVYCSVSFGYIVLPLLL